ncbi:MAG: porphobilinogen synthase [Candidatus Ancaeobacter aquaticus]|nr:porphobilinogen synthase [Candidatus Ancaeobacter aquaticus]
MQELQEKQNQEYNGILLSDMIYPLFVREDLSLSPEIPSMQGIYRYSLDALIDEVRELHRIGIRNILLFGIPKNKEWTGTGAYSDTNIVSASVREIRNHLKDVTIFTDVCLCNYTTHGHCGIIKKGADTIELSDTLNALSEIALSHAASGADYVCPSAMADGQVAAIRKKLDQNGFTHTKIMGYSAKFASHFYGPFREIADSAPKFGNRSAYQLDPRRSEKALDKISRDIDEGADIVMVKPGLGYLDIVRKAKDTYNHPLAVYNVSGEYTLVKNGSAMGLWDEDGMVNEIMHSMKRAGADYIITYHAKDIALAIRDYNDK